MLQFSEMFEDHMVLQHGRPVTVWGVCDREGQTVEVGFAGRRALAEVIKGCFRTSLPSLPPGGPYQLSARCRDESIEKTDVMVGEVWLAGGQSNMEMPLFASEGALEWLNGTNRTMLRVKTISRRTLGSGDQYGYHFIPQFSRSMPWEVYDHRAALHFSAIAGVFGAQLANALKMPVGVISCNFGGTKVQPWVSRNTILHHPAFEGELTRFESRRDELAGKRRESWEVYQKQLREALEAPGDFVESFLTNPDYALQVESRIAWPPEYAIGDANQPACLFEHMLSRVYPFTLRGVIWYQGESSAGDEDCWRYKEQMRALIEDWRGAFEQDDLCWIQLQLAPYDTSRRLMKCDWPAIREAQRQLCQEVRNVHMVNLLGLGESNNIHPVHKIPAACRLANYALARVYAENASAWPVEPALAGAQREGEWVRIFFSQAEGLHIHEHPLQLEEGDGVSFRAAEDYLIAGQTLMLRCKGSVIRYGWRGFPKPGLCNGAMLPVGPFVIEVKGMESV